MSSGFAETGPDGAERQRRLVALARGSGMRVLGPRPSAYQHRPRVALNASLSPLVPARGRLGFFSQSGALGVALLDNAVRRGLGLSTFVSAGNRVDVSGNDLLQFWEEDAVTDAVMLYLESIGNPRKFSRIARRLARQKPVVVVKSGRFRGDSPGGHLVRGTRAPAAAVDALFRRAGVIRADSIHMMFDVAALVATQPLPAGPRVAVLGNSDALGPAGGRMPAKRPASTPVQLAGPGTGRHSGRLRGGTGGGLRRPRRRLGGRVVHPPAADPRRGCRPSARDRVDDGPQDGGLDVPRHAGRP